MRRRTWAALLALLLLAVATPAWAAITKGWCETGGTLYQLEVHTTGATETQWLTPYLSISNGDSDGVHIKMDAYNSAGTHLWNKAEFFDSNGNWSTDPPNLPYYGGSYYRATLDDGWWAADCRIKVAPKL